VKKPLKVGLVFGTRPEIIKLSSLMRLFEKTRTPYFMVHTGQHYSYTMDRVFFKELRLPQPDYALHVRSKSPVLQGDHTGRMLALIERVLLKENPSHVLVQGDTNTVLAGSLAASKISTTRSFSGLSYILGHVEAGLRSYDREMPEELNRFISDHLSDRLFAPTAVARRNLLAEGVDKRKIFVTGNTVVDAVFQNLAIAREAAAERPVDRPARGRYILVTLHRQENVDEPKRLAGILRGIEESSRRLGWPVLFPMHPRTRLKVKKFGIRFSGRIAVTEPVGYFEFLDLQSRAGLVLTDSGGVQEEACILGVPCVTLRTTTERPETVAAGANALAGVESGPIARAAARMAAKRKAWKNPYGDGKAAERILRVLRKDAA
jgi:UDP-N-acetylglucosamine 2-epimerase (non-hydrolysing)